MIRTLHVSQFGVFLAFTLMLMAGCQNRTSDIRATSNEHKDTDQASRATLHQVTLNVTGMS